MTIRDQEQKVKETLADMKDRRKKFGDCNIRFALKQRRNEMERVEILMKQAKEKFEGCKTNIKMLLDLDSTKE